MKISIVIPNYNGEELLSKNLPRLLEILSRQKDIELIISDDCSKDNSIGVANKILGNEKIKYKILKNDKNLGFSSNVNLGAKQATGEIIIFLNTDVVPEKDFLEHITWDFNKNENLFGVGMMDKSIEGEKTVLRGRGIGKWSRGLPIHSRGEVDQDDTFWISGGSSAVRRDIFEKLGGFDSLYDPFYWEDIDLSYRARKSGYDIKFESKSIVEHRHEEGIIHKTFSDSKIKATAYRNQFIFVWKNVTDISFIFSHMVWLPYHLVKALLSGNSQFLAGFFSALIRLPMILLRRNFQNKFYKKSDKELF